MQTVNFVANAIFKNFFSYWIYSCKCHLTRKNIQAGDTSLDTTTVWALWQGLRLMSFDLSEKVWWSFRGQQPKTGCNWRFYSVFIQEGTENTEVFTFTVSPPVVGKGNWSCVINNRDGSTVRLYQYLCVKISQTCRWWTLFWKDWITSVLKQTNFHCGGLSIIHPALIYSENVWKNSVYTS